MNYIVRNGERISDVVMNSTGDISNWEAILKANGFQEWVPELSAGQIIIIPDKVINQASIKSILLNYPANNNSFTSDYLDQAESLLTSVHDITADSDVVPADSGDVTTS
jgi:hypothetical protein